MKIGFYGAAMQVTGSKHLIVTEEGKRILLDCGMFQGRRKIAGPLNQHWGFEPMTIDCVILSHAHIDHAGLIPKLVKDGFRGKIYCTLATYDLCSIMLPDSAYIQENDAEYENKRRRLADKRPIEPLYTTEDAYACLDYFEKVNYREPVSLFPGVQFTFYENGHLLGSATTTIELEENGKTRILTYTSDIGRCKPNMLREPEPFPQSDIIICESTYGDRLHDEDEYTLQDLVQLVRETCLENKGKLIIPAFSIGRTQEIIYALDYLYNTKKLPPIHVYIDSPLSTRSTFIYKQHLSLFNQRMQDYLKTDPDPFSFPFLHFIESVDQSKKLNTSKEPCIIISASGMMEAGRIRHHVANHIGHAKNTLLIVGYCEPTTLGGKLIAGNKIVKISGIEHKVRARIEYIRSYSGHGDYREMIQYLDCQDKKRIEAMVLVHGDYAAQLEFKTRLRRLGYSRIEIPEQGDWLEF
ncbi:MAG: MBL fold metallo-hydrolase [Candidatus Competibacteraceae bacterium]|nr:MBL fold metallo-hydrolase [Candidatus Competibacteraceae bacterium]